MKSAYEAAMERLAKEGGEEKKLSKGQKERLAEIDKIYQAKIAERKVMMDPQIETLRFQGQLEEADVLQQELSKELAKLEGKRESEKDKVRRTK